jgi:hypothetical protein
LPKIAIFFSIILAKILFKNHNIDQRPSAKLTNWKNQIR